MADGTGQTRTGGGAALRLFAALEVPAGMQRTLADLAEGASDSTDDARALAAEQLHVTFAFLGNVSEDYVPAVASALETAAASVPGAIACTLGEPALLGGGRALALDVTLDLHAVADAARDAFVDAVRTYAPGLDDRAWRTHLTVARTRTRPSERTLEVLERGLVERTFVSPELRLYASLPGPTSRIHKVLHAVPFGAPALTPRGA